MKVRILPKLWPLCMSSRLMLHRSGSSCGDSSWAVSRACTWRRRAVGDSGCWPASCWIPDSRSFSTGVQARYALAMRSFGDSQWMPTPSGQRDWSWSRTPRHPNRMPGSSTTSPIQETELPVCVTSTFLRDRSPSCGCQTWLLGCGTARSTAVPRLSRLCGHESAKPGRPTIPEGCQAHFAALLHRAFKW